MRMIPRYLIQISSIWIEYLITVDVDIIHMIFIIWIHGVYGKYFYFYFVNEHSFSNLCRFSVAIDINTTKNQIHQVNIIMKMKIMSHFCLFSTIRISWN